MFEDGKTKHVVIVGGAGGIGNALVQLALSENHNVTATAREPFKMSLQHERLTWVSLDPLDEVQVKQCCHQLGDVDVLINCVGMLHDVKRGIQPEKSLRSIDAGAFNHVMQVNVLPTMLFAKYIKANFKHSSKNNISAVFATISARVGSIEDNRSGGWYSYRASKAALNMCLKNISLEWQRSLKNVCVASLHPGTTDTALSLPFQKNVPEHKLFSPEQTAQYLWDVVGSLTPEQTGQFWAWDGQHIAW